MADVNQQDPEAERYILPQTLFKWAQPENNDRNKGFDSYSIFFNEDEPGELIGLFPPCFGRQWFPFSIFHFSVFPSSLFLGSPWALGTAGWKSVPPRRYR